MTHPFLETREAFNAFVAAWESGELPKAQWTHAAHVAMGAGYVARYGPGAVDDAAGHQAPQRRGGDGRHP